MSERSSAEGGLVSFYHEVSAENFRQHLEVGNNSLPNPSPSPNPNPSPTIPCPTHQQVAGACVHVLVHEVQDSEPESSEGWQGEQRREVLQEDLRRHRQGCRVHLSNTVAMILTPTGWNAGSEK